MSANRQIIYKKTSTTRELRKRVPYGDGSPYRGFTTEPDGTEEVFYEVSLDLSGLDQMAREAAGNKSQVSNDGPLRVKILERRRVA